jgi:uncharacterized protein
VVERRDHLSAPAKGLRAAVRAYQFLFSWRTSPCRYLPSCSTYAVEAIELHGAASGSWLAVRRIGRCHPWGSHGWDPVPGSPDAMTIHSRASAVHDCRSADSGRDDGAIAAAHPLRRQIS